MTSSSAASGLYFFRRFLGNPREVGALCPSTRHLARAMVRGLELRPADVVVEYGVGTGAFTTAIRELVAATPGARYLGIEREAGFCDILRQRFPTLDFANAQVEQISELLAERGLPAPRAILSGLPLIFLPAMPEIIADAARVLAPGGEFRTFSYLQSYPTRGAFKVRRNMRARFERFSISPLVLRNFPPAFVLKGHKAAATAAATA